MALARRLLLLVAALTRRWCVGFAERILAPLSVLLLRDASMRLLVTLLRIFTPHRRGALGCLCCALGLAITRW
eukprot:1572639-Amphidinium_carterae.1